MKKIKKIYALIIIILAIFGITTSVNAYCVDGNNKWDIDNVTSETVVGYLPGEYIPSVTEDPDNTYAKDYILTVGEYTEEERQAAYYCIIGDEDNGVANELYYKALEYQASKLAEEGEVITLKAADDATTFVNGENLVYGPIYMTYPYGEIEERRTWGGCYYGFFDEDGNNISSKIQLCTLENGEYKDITSELSAEGEMEGYYKITSEEYNNETLYIKTTDWLISKVFMKVRSFQIVKKASIIRVEGTVTVEGGTWYCGDCSGKTERVQVGSKPVTTLITIGGNPKVTPTCWNCGGEWHPRCTTTEWMPVYDDVPISCGKTIPVYKNGVALGSYACGQSYSGGTYTGQAQEKMVEEGEEEELFDWAELEIELGSTIEVTKKWNDYENSYEVRPERLYFNVYRSTDKNNWELLTENEDYVVATESKDSKEWIVFISGLLRLDENGNDYYFKVEEKDSTYYDPTYPEGNEPTFADNPAYGYLTIENTLKKIDIAGYVWLDGQTGIKPAEPNNGKMEDSEEKLSNIKVYLYYKNPETGEVSKIAETVTDEKGYYEFLDYEIGYYYVEFGYDGVHYEDTIKVEDANTEKISKAFENDNERSTFNSRFTTITYKKSNDGTTLNYEYADKKSTLITANQDGTVTAEFEMNAETENELRKTDTDNLNLGLVKRGLDAALSTDVYDASVTINGQATDYTFNKDDNTIDIGTTQTSETVSYNLNLYASDYNYRIRNYVNTQDFQEKDYINDGTSGVQTGDELRVYVTYKLNLQNQSTKTTRINEVKYTYDEKYTFVGLENSSYNVQDSGNVVTINLNGLSLGDGETQTLYLVFEVKDNNGLSTGEFTNKAEITSYSNDEGLIDVDSQPGNFINNNEVEDDSDTAGGLTVTVPSENERKITGKVFDEDGNNVNDVIVQLIELKTVNGKIYEYIWQETVSGTNSGLRLNADGSALETYSYTASEGYYEFKGFIPGDYIVRFIYGDGTTYDMTSSVIKYNGQDYKSMVDSNYNAEWYNTSAYSAGASVARDNEARRLETMAYSVEINSVKGILLKLLNNVTPDTLNQTEKEVLIATYNYYYDPDITQVTQEAINTLLKEHTLKNTWMCAETSKIKVAVDTEDATNTNVTTTVNGINTTYKNNITDINFGLEQRPVTKIELKKYITGMKLTAANGQTLVNAYVDVNEYLNGTTDISNKVQGIKDNVTILNNVWQYEVVPTEINTVVDGASLEFEYTLVVRNTGDTDYLSEELANAYNTSSISDYKTTLTTKASEIKGYIRQGTYRENIGNAVGNSYYAGGTGTGKVLTEVINIRDYVNNELSFVTSGKVEIDENAPHTHRILRDDYSMQEATINTILKTTESTGKLSNEDNSVMYVVTVGKDPISSTGKLEFDTYIAEVMSYTNAAGRRATTSTPGNAEIVDAEKREGKSHEIDEADTGRIQIGAATGEDKTTNNMIIISVVAGIAVLATGAFVVKKYVIK